MLLLPSKCRAAAFFSCLISLCYLYIIKANNSQNLNLKVKQLTIEKTESNGLLETFIETEQEKYEAKNGIACNYTPFCFVARIDDIVVGAISGARGVFVLSGKRMR